jgi:hypothetical protein
MDRRARSGAGPEHCLPLPAVPDALYWVGIRRLLAGQPDAAEPLSQSVRLQPNVAVAHIALSCAFHAVGKADLAAQSAVTARARVAGASRRDRQHVEILAAAIDRRVAHAIDLAFEHLAEFTPDLLVVYQLTWCVHDDGGRDLTTQLRALVEQLHWTTVAEPAALGVFAWAYAVTDDPGRGATLANHALTLDPANATAANALVLARRRHR